MTPDELARLSALRVDGWLSTDHVSWVVYYLNNLKRDVICICPNTVVDPAREMQRHGRKSNLDKLNSILFVINVGKQSDDTTFVGSWQKAGSHWIVVNADFRSKKVLYCDSSAWSAPPNIIELVNSYIQHIPTAAKFIQRDLQLAHVSSPYQIKQGNSPHVCSTQCRNYPVQTCSDVCGVISLIVASLSVLDRPVFEFMIGARAQVPSEYNCYLRRVLMTWFVEEKVITELVSPRNFTTNIQFLFNHDHTFASSRKQKVASHARTGSSPKVNVPPGSSPKVNVPPGGLPKVNVPPGGSPKVNGPPGGSPKVNVPPGGSPKVNVPPGGSPKVNGPPGGSPKVNVAHGSSPETKKYVCPHCGVQLSSRNCLYKHKKRKHKQLSPKKQSSPIKKGTLK